MLDLVNIENIEINKIQNEFYDIGIFASGYETRSSFLARNIDPNKIKFKIILGFLENNEGETRKENDAFYSENFGVITECSSQEEKDIYVQLIKIFKIFEQQKEVKILIDYTSMARIWYSGIFNFFRLQKIKRITLYINYCPGIYDKTLLDYSYSSINSLPFHEGSLSSNSKTLLVLGIGFTPYVIKSVIEEIEPNYTIGILPIPLQPIKESISVEMQNNILATDIDQWVVCPMNDLEYIFSNYAEICNNNLNSRDILFLSLGPKVLTMASLLVAQRFNQVTCLYLRSSKNLKMDIMPTGEFICNKISYLDEYL